MSLDGPAYTCGRCYCLHHIVLCWNCIEYFSDHKDDKKRKEIMLIKIVTDHCFVSQVVERTVCWLATIFSIAVYYIDDQLTTHVTHSTSLEVN